MERKRDSLKEVALRTIGVHQLRKYKESYPATTKGQRLIDKVVKPGIILMSQIAPSVEVGNIPNIPEALYVSLVKGALLINTLDNVHNPLLALSILVAGNTLANIVENEAIVNMKVWSGPFNDLVQGVTRRFKRKTSVVA